jgi:hypothetical protein
MTTTTTPDALSRLALPEGSLPCRACGQAVRNPDPAATELLRFVGPAIHGGSFPSPEWDVPVSRCDLCAARRALAAELLRSFPAVARLHGDVALDRLDAALAAADLLGDKRGRQSAKLIGNAQELADFIDAMAPTGGAAFWSTANVRPGASGSGRWSHVSGQLAADAREAHRLLLRRRVETVGPVEPPASAELRGCVYCGVGAVTARESEAGTVWDAAIRVPLTVLNAGAEVVTGHLCPECRTDHDAAGAIGMPAAWRSLLRFRGYRLEPGRSIRDMPGVRPWAALATGTRPNATRWQHVDLAAVDRMLAWSHDVSKAVAG